MDISIEPILFPQDPQGTDHQLCCIVRTAQNPGGEEETLNIISAVEIDRKVCKLFRCERGAFRIIAAAVDTVFAVIYAAVRHQNFQQSDTAAVRRKGVATPCHRGRSVANVSLFRCTVSAAGSTGGIIFGCIGQDRQFLKNIHDTMKLSGPLRAGGNGGQDARLRRSHGTTEWSQMPRPTE